MTTQREHIIDALGEVYTAAGPLQAEALIDKLGDRGLVIRPFQGSAYVALPMAPTTVINNRDIVYIRRSAIIAVEPSSKDPSRCRVYMAGNSEVDIAMSVANVLDLIEPWLVDDYDGIDEDREMAP